MTTKRKKRQEVLPMNYGDELPPKDVELEEIVLGCVIIEGSILHKVIADFSPNLFYSDKHRLICEIIIELYAGFYPVDIVTVTMTLKSKGLLDKVGGAYFVSSLTNRVASSANVEYYLRILQQQALKRKLIHVCSTGVRKAFDETEDIFDTFQELQINLDNAIKEIIHYEVEKVGTIHNQIIKESIDIINKGGKSGIPTGLRMVDNVTNGWQKSDLIILAGRPSMGKTAAAVSMMLFPALRMEIPVAIFSLEMSNQQLVSRIQSSLSKVNVSKIVKKQLDMSEIEIISNTCEILNKSPLFIDDTPNISLLELKGKARKLVKETGVKLIVIDYLQLMRSGMNINNREQEIAEISRGLKGLAKELDIPIIALSQLSRGVESRTDKKPMLSDLRESGQIEQDADMVMFCYRPEYYGIEQYEVGSETFDSKGLFMLIISKHRNGELGEIPLTFIHEQTKLINHSFNSFDNEENNRTFVQQNEEGREGLKLPENTNFLNEGLKSYEEDIPF